MKDLSFLDSLGESKDKYKILDFDKDVHEKIKLLDTLCERNLMSNDFKDELIDIYLNKKISNALFYGNVRKSIEQFCGIELQLLSVDENMFKEKSDALVYIGSIPRYPWDNTAISKTNGRISYSLTKHLFDHLKDRVVKLGELVELSDILEVKLIKLFNVKQITPNNG
jgi:hypothetical protein